MSGRPEAETMLRKKLTACSAVGIAAILVFSGCSSGGTVSNGTTDSRTVGDTRGDGKTLKVWVMTGDYSDATIAAIDDEFTAKTGAKVDVQTQQWDGITTKISTALSTTSTPDVLDLGNTQVANYAGNGALLDLTPYRADLAAGQTWLAGLEEPATVEGRLYAVPGFAGASAVVYNKTMWAEAGVTEAPTTYEQLTSDLDRIAAANASTPDFSPFYLPGQYWYAGVQFVWDAGGELATFDGGRWTAGLGSPEAQQGLNDYKTFQNTYSSKASRTLNTDSPAQTQIFADGKTSAVLASNGYVGILQKADPGLTDADLGTFPFPGKSGKAQPVMLGGSDWGIAAKSQNSDLALQWAKIAASPSIQTKWVYGGDGWIPNSTETITSADGQLSDSKKGFFDAALNSRATPASGAWAGLEGDRSINQLFVEVASGSKSPADAADTFDAAADKTLNAK